MNDDSTNFDDGSFWEKLRNFAVAAGKELVEKALWLYYAAQRPETPIWAKAVIYSALTYFVVPMDAIPDAVPVVGYSDDLGALAAAIATCAVFINDEVKRRTREKMRDWFGDAAV